MTVTHSSLCKAALALYVAGAIVTFGHAAAAAQRQIDLERERCTADPDRICLIAEKAPLSGFFGGLAWPLYWSWEAWS